MLYYYNQEKGIAMRKMILLLVLAISVISVTIPAWATVGSGPGDVVYEDPAPPKN